MSASTQQPDFDFTAQLIRLRRDMAESEKFAAEQRKLSQEAFKLTEEALKLRRDRLLLPITILAALGGLGGLVTLIQFAIRLGAGHP